MKAFILLSSTFVIIYLRSRDKQFYYLPLSSREEKDDWIGKGTFEYDRVNKCYMITNSSVGYIYCKCLDWSDYQVTFKFKIIDNNMSVIVRAINLSNYLMLQFQPNGIRPHIRINGGWRTWEAAETKLEFSAKLSLDKWYKCQVKCNQDTINIQVYEDGEQLFERQWRIPDGHVSFNFGEKAQNIQIPFSINLEYGSIGFRNADKEKTLIKDVVVQKI